MLDLDFFLLLSLFLSHEVAIAAAGWTFGERGGELMWECGKVGVDDRWVGLPCRYLSIYSLQSTSSTLLIDGRYGVNKHEPQEIPVAILPNTPAVFVDRWMDGWMDGWIWILVEGGSRGG